MKQKLCAIWSIIRARRFYLVTDVGEKDKANRERYNLTPGMCVGIFKDVVALNNNHHEMEDHLAAAK
jgi:hypothetical protein